MLYRLGLDVGTNSLGWWIWAEDDSGLVIRAVDGGVRIFGDGRNPKDKSSLATKRRVPRGARRRRDRYLKRRTRLMGDLVDLGLMPADQPARKKLEGLDPYFLRVKALDAALRPHELGRALFHLNQRRGFKSNRKISGDEKEEGIIRKGISQLDEAMQQAEARTLGEYLYLRRQKRQGTRARAGAGFYADRRHYADEFAKIREAQAPHQTLKDADWDKLEDRIFFQRELKPVDPGRCTFCPTEERAPLALPISQRFRILQETANLEIITPGEPDRPLSPNERKTVIRLLLNQKKVDFNRMRKELDLSHSQKFNLESSKRKFLKGDETAACLANRGIFGSAWRMFDFHRQTLIVRYLLNAENEENVIQKALGEWELDKIKVEKLAQVRLPAGYGRLSIKAMQSIIPELENGLRYHEAVRSAFPDQHHSEGIRVNHCLSLPYYPEVEKLKRHLIGSGNPDAKDIFDHAGRISNPTVHIGLNQIRKLMNAVIKEYGHPKTIIVELSRDLKNSLEKRRDIERKQTEEQGKNERRKEQIESCGHRWTPELLRRLRLWEEQGSPNDRHCPYCLQPIGFRMVIESEVDVDHILPFSKTLDDSMANKVICCRRCNRVKSNQTPAEAFENNPSYDYDNILRCSSNLPQNKRWRFQPGAIDRFNDEGRDFLDRQLNETRYLARIAKDYLETVCKKVDVTQGHLTGLLRGKWGLNKILSDSNLKNRSDHRHHAVDAAVIGLTDRGMLQLVATAAAKGIESDRLIEDMPRPPNCPGFQRQIVDRVTNMVVWHKPDHTMPGKIEGTSNALHNDTAYGIVSGPDKQGFFVVVKRKTVDDLKNEHGLEGVVDSKLQKNLIELWKHMRSLKPDCKWKELVEKAAQPGVVTRDGVRHVRVREKMADPIQILDQDGNAYKAYKSDGNAFMDIFKQPNSRWKGETVRIFDANQPNFVPSWEKEYGKLAFVMRLHNNDLIAIGKGKMRRILRVVKMSGQKITCADAYEGGSLKKRHVQEEDHFRYFEKSASAMQKEGLRRLRIDDLGRIFDPGPKV